MWTNYSYQFTKQCWSFVDFWTSLASFFFLFFAAAEVQCLESLVSLFCFLVLSIFKSSDITWNPSFSFDPTYQQLLSTCHECLLLIKKRAFNHFLIKIDLVADWLSQFECHKLDRTEVEKKSAGRLDCLSCDINIHWELKEKTGL